MIKTSLLILCLTINVYVLAAMVFFATIAYPQLSMASSPGFAPIYQSFTRRVPLTVAIWELAAFLVTLPLYFVRPDTVTLWSVHLLVSLGVLYFAITFGWHLPAHRRLERGDNSAEAMTPLLTSQWARTWVQLTRTGLLLYLTLRLF